MATRTVKEGTRAHEAVRWMEDLVGKVRYEWWTSGNVPEGPPAYAKNAPVPSKDTIRRGGIFCAVVPNLMLRKIGKRIATYGNLNYDCGTLAYREYFRGYAEPFDLGRALKVAYDDRAPVLIGSPFKSNINQGHVGVVLPSGYLLQSYTTGGGQPGLTWNVHTEVTVRFWTPTYMVLAPHWINYSGDEF
jgi:hypothetical protein